MTQHIPGKEMQPSRHTLPENPMAKALREADYLAAGAIAADEIERLEVEITQLRQDKADLLDVLIGKPFGLNKERFPEKHGYCFCGVAIDDPNYGGEHGPCCLNAQAAIAKNQQ